MVTHRDGERSGGGSCSHLGSDGTSAVEVAGHRHPVHNQAHCHDEGDDGEEEQAGHGANCLAGHLDACYGHLHAQVSYFIHFVPYSLGCGATYGSSDILA